MSEAPIPAVKLTTEDVAVDSAEIQDAAMSENDGDALTPNDNAAAVAHIPETKAAPTGKKRGRPKGSLNKRKPIEAEPKVKRPRGRPRKDNKTKDELDKITPPAEPIPFTTEDYPQLAIDPTLDDSNLATSFIRPLFPPEGTTTSKPLQIAYSHQAVASHERTIAQCKKNVVLDEYKRIREKYLQKKLELSLANDEVEKCNKDAGAWTKKVFDLELEEPCEWNDMLEKLKRYKDEYNKLPPKNISRCEEGDEKELAKWLEGMKGNKIKEEDKEIDNEESGSPKKQPKIDLSDYPHRIEALKAFNVHFQQKVHNKFETMFQKLLDYKEEHGTLRFPSDEQCAASGDEEIIALQKWVKSQVLNFRYSKKKIDPTIVKRFLDIGFSFERWFAKPGKRKSSKSFDEIAKSAAEEAEDDAGDDLDQKMPTQGIEEYEEDDLDQKMPAQGIEEHEEDDLDQNIPAQGIEENEESNMKISNMESV